MAKKGKLFDLTHLISLICVVVLGFVLSKDTIGPVMTLTAMGFLAVELNHIK